MSVSSVLFCGWGLPVRLHDARAGRPYHMVRSVSAHCATQNPNLKTQYSTSEQTSGTPMFTAASTPWLLDSLTS